jgi:hypothetical protein
MSKGNNAVQHTPAQHKQQFSHPLQNRVLLHQIYKNILILKLF